jgi:hypothetical protein
MENTRTAVTAMDKLLEQLSNCFDAEIRARVEVLADKSNEGLLTEEERDEYRSYVELADLIATLKLKAQRRLSSNGSS